MDENYERTLVRKGDAIRVVERVNKSSEDDFHFIWNMLDGEKLGFSIDLSSESKAVVEPGAVLIVTEVRKGRPIVFQKVRFE